MAVLNPIYRLRLVQAFGAFYRADYSDAYSRFEDLVERFGCARSLKMLDWIDLKFGNFLNGWPAYPGFHSQPSRRNKSWPSQQDPSITRLSNHWRLPAWAPDSGHLSPLIWFNFIGSIGGELLGLALVIEALSRFSITPTLVVDPRMHSFATRVLPGVPVVERSGSLSKTQHVDSYLLVRDLLGFLVGSEEDFSPIRRGLKSRYLATPYFNDGRVGFTWKTTNPRQSRYRNISIAAMSGLLRRIPGPLVSLQHGVTGNERKYLRKALGDRLSFDFDPEADVNDMATQVSRLAAVASVDNSILHLAGFVGTPTVGLLAKPSYWAWADGTQQSRWYSTVHLIHQSRPGDWSPVLAATREVLDAMVHVSAPSQVASPSAPLSNSDHLGERLDG